MSRSEFIKSLQFKTKHVEFDTGILLHIWKVNYLHEYEKGVFT